MSKTRHSFVVDLNKCTGCHACEIACEIANPVPDGGQWREVRSFNELHVPGIEMVHLSMACNHCREAPCMSACPATAYYRDEDTGAVLINADACIGCQYCAWACPYGAPSFDEQAGVMTKCNMCNDRVKAGGTPACVVSCPTGALGWQQLAAESLTQAVPGFADVGADPSIRIEGVQADRRAPEQTTPPALPPWQKLRERIAPHITLGHEWTLAVFSTVAAVLVGAFCAGQWGGPAPDWRAFAAVGAAGMLLSASHLGRRERAWRAPLHVLSSWLSREIVLFSAFMGLGVLVLAGVGPDLPPLAGRLVAGVGLLALFAIDRVYGPTRVRGGGTLHSAHVLGTGLLLAAVGTRADLVVLSLAGLKALLFAARQINRSRLGLGSVMGLVVPRLGFLAAGALWPHAAGAEDARLAAAGMILLGELIDRGLYYTELEVSTPNSRMLDEMALRPEACGIFSDQEICED